MEPHIITFPGKQLVGMRMRMSLANNQTTALWRAFMPAHKNMAQRIGPERYSLTVYDARYFDHFSPHHAFDKWAAVEVSDDALIPEGMEPFTLPGGLYAVFHYQGSSTNTRIFSYIFNTWLPQSDYRLDHRPHFEVLDEKYRNDSPDSEEDIWIPIQPKG